MNILFVLFTFEVGGIQKLLIDITNNLASDRKNNVYLCIINNIYDTELLRKLDKNINVLLLNRNEKGSRIKYIIKYTKFIKKNRIDVIHCHLENSVKFSILAKLICPKIKIFVTVHDTNIFSELKSYEVFLDRIFCRRIIAISDVVKNEILSRGIPEKKVVRIYNGIDLKKFSIKVNRKFNQDHVVIGNVARIIPSKKGQDILIKAIGELKHKYPNILCLFAGQVPVNKLFILDDLVKLCESKNISDNVKFLGNIYDIKEFLEEIDIFVMPSLYEGFGISLIEAMAAGIPCIASNIDGPKEIIKEEYGLLFQKGDYYSLAEKIDYRIQNIKFDRKKINEYITKNFDINFMINRLINIYKD
jgi:glycosyltransferase involved in cell wall biosynthesis